MDNGILECMRVRMLQDIFENFQQVSQWLPHYIDNAMKYVAQAEGLVEFLEVEDCGSVGGFDPENKVEHITGYNLYDRFLALVAKYDDAANIEYCCGFTPFSLGEYFKRVEAQRHEVLSEMGVGEDE